MSSVSKLAAGGFVVAALAAVGLSAALSRPVAATSPPPALAADTGPAVRSTLFCPDLRQIAGSVTAAPAGGATPAPATVLGPRRVAGTYDRATSGPLVLRATGPLTAGVVAEQIGRGNKTADRGWAEARCEPPRTDQWFVGAATAPGDAPAVILANPGDTRAIVTISVLTPKGLMTVPAGSNLVLGPHTTPAPVPLVDLAPGVGATAVEVRTTMGLVSAAVRDVRSAGATLLGTDYVPVGQPSTTLTIPGLPGTVVGSPPSRTLYVANPGTDPATVRVTVTTGQGSFVPTGLDAVDVTGQSLRAVPLTAILADSPAMVTVTSQAGDGQRAPVVVAGVLVDAGSTKAAGAGIREIAYLGAVGPLLAPSVIPVVRDPVDTDSVLVVSAPRTAATVNITAVPPAGRPPLVFSRAVAAGHTITVSMHRLAVPDTSSVTIAPTQNSGPVYVGRVIEEDGALGPLLSAFQVAGEPATRVVPAVRPLSLGGAAGP